MSEFVRDRDIKRSFPKHSSHHDIRVRKFSTAKSYTLFLLCMLLPPATKLRQGSVFTPVYDYVHGGEGVSFPACTKSHMTRGVSFQGGLCLGVSVQGGISVQGGVSVQGVSVQGGLCLGGLSRGSLSGRPPSRRPPYSNEQALRILLEYILVLWYGILALDKVNNLSFSRKPTTHLPIDIRPMGYVLNKEGGFPSVNRSGGRQDLG